MRFWIDNRYYQRFCDRGRAVGRGRIALGTGASAQTFDLSLMRLAVGIPVLIVGVIELGPAVKAETVDVGILRSAVSAVYHAICRVQRLLIILKL